jgi:predicted O-methyltransferase YrrM
VEAGTAAGDTVAYFAPLATRVVTVELDPELHRRAADRFGGHENVAVMFGDAVHVVPEVVKGAESPPLVWLDGHFSGEGTAVGDEVEPAPTLLELLAPVSPSGTTIVVDDLRLFVVEPDYPGLDELVATARRAFPTGNLYVSLDALVIEA